MGQVVFWMLHLAAVVFAGGLLLFITIPAHLIYNGTRKKETKAPWEKKKSPFWDRPLF
jgi:hypothetical protein